MISIRSVSRHLLATILALAIASGPAVFAADCKLVNAQLDGSIRVCAESPVGLCSSATIRSGLLAGEISARRDAVAPGAGLGGVSPRALAYSAVAIVATGEGVLQLRRVGVSDLDNRSFVEINEIVAASGLFAGARGTLHVTGSLDTREIATGFHGKISGRFCIE